MAHVARYEDLKAAMLIAPRLQIRGRHSCNGLTNYDLLQLWKLQEFLLRRGKTVLLHESEGHNLFYRNDKMQDDEIACLLWCSAMLYNINRPERFLPNFPTSQLFRKLGLSCSCSPLTTD